MICGSENIYNIKSLWGICNTHYAQLDDIQSKLIEILNLSFLHVYLVISMTKDGGKSLNASLKMVQVKRMTG